MNKKKDERVKFIAVLDVGKSNKKLCVFDQNLRLIESMFASFDDYSVDGSLLMPVKETSEWFLDGLKTVASKYPIGVISIATYGSAFVCINSEGELAVPTLSPYLNEPLDDFYSRFYKALGNEKDLHINTATPPIPGLGNLAKGIYYVKEKFPAEFALVDTFLPLPQYYGFLLTGKKGIDYTCLGCHSYLWDYNHLKMSTMVDKLGIRDKLPHKVSRPWDVLGMVSENIVRRTGLDPSTIVTVGIHDSNASLLPHLIKEKGPFILNSTGTVFVAMRPGKITGIGHDDLGKVIYYNMSALGKPVKTSMFLGGLEFDIYKDLLLPNQGSSLPQFNRKLCERVLKEKRYFILPSLIPFGMFPDSPARAVQDGKTFTFGDIASGTKPEFFSNVEEAFVALNVSLAYQTKFLLNAAGYHKGDLILVEGGFRKNDTYMAALASLFPECEVDKTNLEEATSFGVAMIGLCALENIQPADLEDRFEIEKQRMDMEPLKGIDEYSKDLTALIRKN